MFQNIPSKLLCARLYISVNNTVFDLIVFNASSFISVAFSVIIRTSDGMTSLNI